MSLLCLHERKRGLEQAQMLFGAYFARCLSTQVCFPQVELACYPRMFTKRAWMSSIDRTAGPI